MGDRFRAGERVRTRLSDPPHHTRLPSYVRGARGEIVAPCGRHPLADDRARGFDTPPQTVYQVRFRADQLFGDGDHDVVVELFESYLEPDRRGEGPR